MVSFSPRRPGFFCVGSVVGKVTLGQVFLGVLRCVPVGAIRPLLHIHTRIIWGLTNGQFRKDIVSVHPNYSSVK